MKKKYFHFFLAHGRYNRLSTKSVVKNEPYFHPSPQIFNSSSVAALYKGTTSSIK